MGTRSFSELVAELEASAEEVAWLAKGSLLETEMFIEFAVLAEKLELFVADLGYNIKVMDEPPIRQAVESLGKEFKRAKALIESYSSGASIKHMEDVAHDMGGSLGLLLFAAHQVPGDVKERIGHLQKELMNARFDLDFTSSSESLINCCLVEDDDGEIVEERVSLDIEGVVLQLKYGNHDDLNFALFELSHLIKTPEIDYEWIDGEGIVPILFNRLGSSGFPVNRLSIIWILRALAYYFPETKEKMSDVGFLSSLVKSLTRDVDERREAVGLLLKLSDIQAVRRRVGRIEGCIVLLVALLNEEEDMVASHDATKLLNALSGNTQNALHMAEAGYFKPLVQHLKEGSDMSKILMATSLARMELTDQCRASLGKDGAIEPLVNMFTAGKLEAKLSSLCALQNLSSSTENIHRLTSSGIVVPLLQLLFSVTSVLMTLQEPASIILARIAQSESILVDQDIVQQMFSLLNLSSPIIQNHLLQALNSIAGHPSASKIKWSMRENGAFQLLLPFLTDSNTKIRIGALDLLYSLSKDLIGELMEQLGETHINTVINIISSSTCDSEKAAAVGVISNLPISNKKATVLLKSTDLLPTLIDITSSSLAPSSPAALCLVERVAATLIRFTVPSDKNLQLLSAEQGVIPWLVKCLSSGSPAAKCRAATSLAQLSQNTIALKKARKAKWFCVHPCTEAFCEVHDGNCFVKTTFCLVKSGAVPLLIQILEGTDREADEAVLKALATLLHDEISENGSKCIAKLCGIQAIINILKHGSVKAQEKSLWILERVFRIEEHRTEHGESAQVVLIDLAQKGDPGLKPTIAKLLAQLELLQEQSSYF